MFRSSILFGVLLASAVVFAGCEVVGYDATPSIGGTAWEVVETVGPDGAETVIRTRATANSFFGRVMSIFSRPSLSRVCGAGGREWRIDWREAVGPPHEARSVTILVDGERTSSRSWSVSESGRVTTTSQSLGITWTNPVPRVLSASVVNRRGDVVILVFGVSGYQTLYDAHC